MAAIPPEYPSIELATQPTNFTLRTWLAGSVLLAVLIGVAFASSATSPFLNFDDPLYVVTNERIHAPGLAGFLELWNPHDADTGIFIEYFPLRDSIYWCLWQIFGEHQTPFHLASLASHFSASLLVAALGCQLRLSRWASWTAAIVFAVHPGHLESVAWIAGLKDPMYTSFLIAAVICYARALEERRRFGSIAAIALLTLSLLCKSMGFIAPALFLLVERLSPGQSKPRDVALRLLPSTLVCLAFLLHFLWIARVNGVIVPPHGGSWTSHTIAALWTFTRYIQQAVVPYDFEFNRCFLFPNGAWDLRFAVGIVVAAAYVMLLIRIRNRRLPFFLLGWFVVCLFPVMNIIPFPALLADRYLYAPSIALCLGLGVLGDRMQRWRRAMLLAAVVVTLSSVTAARGSLWHRESLLWQNTIDDEACVDSNSHLNIGNALSKTEPGAALASYHRGMNIPGFADLAPGVRCHAHAAASQAALEIGELPLAKRHVEQATSICPEMEVMWQAASTVYAAANDVPRELDAAERAAALAALPGAVGAGKPLLRLIWNRGVARFDADRVDDAAADFSTCIRADDVRFCSTFLSWQHHVNDRPAARDRVTALVGPVCRP